MTERFMPIHDVMAWAAEGIGAVMLPNGTIVPCGVCRPESKSEARCTKHANRGTTPPGDDR